MRIALVTNIPAPYRMPVYRALAATPGWTLRIFVDAASEFDRSWPVDTGGVDVERVRGASFRRRIATRGAAAAEQVVTVHLPFGLLPALRRFRPDVVISAELGPRTALARVYARIFRRPHVVWAYHSKVGATSAGRMRRALRRALLAGADAVVGMGAQARAVLRDLGVPEDRLFDAPNAHDHERIVRRLAAIDPNACRSHLARAIGVRSRIALVAGRLVPVKGIEPLLRAWSRLQGDVRAGWTLLFVGDGPLEAAVRAAAEAVAPGEIARIPAKTPDELVDVYAASDLLLFPSLGDQWGLVVNEAMAAGVPVVCSRLAGCADDLVEDGRNGWAFDPTDADDFSRTLLAALTCPDRAARSEAARAAAARFGPEIMARGIRAAVGRATNRPRLRRHPAVAGAAPPRTGR